MIDCWNFGELIIILLKVQFKDFQKPFSEAGKEKQEVRRKDPLCGIVERHVLW